MDIGRFKRVMVLEPMSLPVPESPPTLVPELIPEPAAECRETVPDAVR